MSYLIELRVVPSPERGQEGFVILLKVAPDEGGPHAQVWVQQGFFLELLTTLELTSLPSFTPPLERVEGLLDALQKASVSAAPPFYMGLHATTFRLMIMRGFNSSVFAWNEKLPAQWQQLEPVVTAFEALARDCRTTPDSDV